MGYGKFLNEDFDIILSPKSQGRQTRYVGAKTILLVLQGQIPFILYLHVSRRLVRCREILFRFLEVAT